LQTGRNVLRKRPIADLCSGALFVAAIAGLRFGTPSSLANPVATIRVDRRDRPR
jgi:hypothetical protein